MKVGDIIYAQFRTLPEEFTKPRIKDDEKCPVRKATIVYIHPEGRYLVAEYNGVKESFLPKEVFRERIS